jgi:zinc protease
MGIRPPSGKVDKQVYKGKDPKSLVAMYFEVNEPWDPMESHMFSSLGQLLDIRYTEVLREQMSGIYGMGVNLSLVKIPYNHLEVSIMIPCSPKKETLTKATLMRSLRFKRRGVNRRPQQD